MRDDNIVVTKENITSVGLLHSIKDRGYRYTKRLFDVLISFVGIVFLIPIVFVVKILYLCSGDFASIFYTQNRFGLNGKIFKLYKIRTMRIDADDILADILANNEELRIEYETTKKMKHDPRITKFGGIIRKLSLDEFPQFINIFKGDMSLVGNRPYLPREREDMGIYFDDIVKTKPGLTGYWQTRGRSNTTFLCRLQMEQEYSKIRCFSLDIKIIFKTFLQLFKHDGAV